MTRLMMGALSDDDGFRSRHPGTSRDATESKNDKPGIVTKLSSADGGNSPISGCRRDRWHNF
jgi:hypothetical protein